MKIFTPPPRARVLISSLLLTGLLSTAPSAFARPPFEWKLLPVDKCELKEIEVEDIECCICQLANQPGPIKSCLAAKGDIGKIGDKVVCKMPPRELLDKPRAINTNKGNAQLMKRPPSAAEDGKVWGNSQWGKTANRPPPLYPNDYPDETKALPPPPKDVFYPSEEEAKQFKSLDVKERIKTQQQKAQKPPYGNNTMPPPTTAKNPPFGHPPPFESKKLPPPGSTPFDPTAMDSKE